ncbi:MAG: Putative transmembrane protein, partial [uncultured Caballeronia sp.]
ARYIVLQPILSTRTHEKPFANGKRSVHIDEMNQFYEPYPPPVYQNSPDSERLRSLRTLTHVLYALYAAYWLKGGLTVRRHHQLPET